MPKTNTEIINELKTKLQELDTLYDGVYQSPDSVYALRKTIQSFNITITDWNTLLTYINSHRSSLDGLLAMYPDFVDAFEEITDNLTTEIDGLKTSKVDKLSTSGQYVYSHLGSTQGELPVSTPANGDTIAKRESDGRLKVSTPTSDNDATTKLYVDDNLSLKLDKRTTSGKYAYAHISGQQGEIQVSEDVINNAIPNRTSAGQLKVPTTPTDNAHATSKKYVDDNLLLKADKATTYTKTETDAAINSAISSVYRYKGTVSTYSNLPSTGLTIGDVYNVEDTGDNYAWTGTAWDKLAGTIDLSDYYNKSQTDILLDSKADKSTTYTKTQVDGLLSTKANTSNVYSKTETNNLLNDKANVDGNYPTMTVGLAEGLVSDRTVDNPEVSCPPITMGITGGKAEISTGINKFQYMEGKSKVWNQPVKNGNFANTNNWYRTTTYTSFSVSDNVATLEITAEGGSSLYINLYQALADLRAIVGHKYLVLFTVKTNVSGITVNSQFGASLGATALSTEWQTIGKIATATDSSKYLCFYFSGDYTVGNKYYFRDVMVFDLTLMGLDSITTVDEFKALFPLDYYAYDAGSIKSAKSYALVSRGRQQWNEQVSFSGTTLSSANRIYVIPGQKYFIHAPKDVSITYFKAGQLFPSSLEVVQKDSVFTVPYNCESIMFSIENYGTEYNDDITLSVWFEDGYGYNEYYKHRSQTVHLPNIELRSVPDYTHGGEIKDIAYAVGGGKRRVGVVDLGSFDYFSQTAYGVQEFYSRTTLSDAKLPPQEYNRAMILCAKYTTGTRSGGVIDRISLSTTGQIIITEDGNYTTTEFKNLVSGVILYYQLAEETDIPLSENPGWSENVYVDNYGTLQFYPFAAYVIGINFPIVEQPYYIEYTISLTEFLDSTYVKFDGDPDKIAEKQEVDKLIKDLENGTFVVAKSQTAEQIENVSDETGSTQTAPFLFQATGTDDNTTSTPTAPIAKHLELRGNSVADNQLMQNGNFANGTNNFTFENGSGNVSNNVLTLTRSASGRLTINQTQNIVYNHYYLISYKVKVVQNSSTTDDLILTDSSDRLGYNTTLVNRPLTNGTTYNAQSIIQATGSGGTTTLRFFRINSGNVGDSYEVSNVQFIDLTLMYGAGNEPITVLQFLRDYPLPYYSYNAGTLKSCKSKKLITIGCNQFDGEFKQGDPSGSQESVISSKNFIKVIPGQDYILTVNTQKTLNVRILREYDANFNEIRLKYVTLGNAYTLEDDVRYVKIQFNVSSGNTLSPSDVSDTMFRLSWNEKHEYVDYEKHEYDIPQVELKSAGSVCDILKSDGTLIRRIGSVDLRSITFTGSSGYYYSVSGSDIRDLVKKPSSNSEKANIICSTLIALSKSYVDSNVIGISISDSGAIVLDNPAWSDVSQINGTLYYELATPTETQDTSKAFAENVIVDDFGTMEFVPSDDNVESASNPIVPQGNKFFYPADYVLFIDDMYKRSKDGGEDADANNFVVQSELTAEDTKVDNLYAIMQENIGGALRHQLAKANNLDFNNTIWVDLGSLTYIYYPADGLYYALLSTTPTDNGACICPLYKSTSPSSSNDKVVRLGQSGYFASCVVIKDTSLGTDATKVPSLLKGILFAYQKASE